MRDMDVNTRTVIVPAELPAQVTRKFDQELFALCRNDDYAGLYRALIKRAAEAMKQGEGQ